MDFKIGYLSTKHIAPDVHFFKPDEIPPPTNKRVLCFSKYGCIREGVFNPNFDSQWLPLPIRAK